MPMFSLVAKLGTRRDPRLLATKCLEAREQEVLGAREGVGDGGGYGVVVCGRVAEGGALATTYTSSPLTQARPSLL